MVWSIKNVPYILYIHCLYLHKIPNRCLGDSSYFVTSAEFISVQAPACYILTNLFILLYSQVSVSRDTAVQPNNTSNDQKGKTFTTKVLMGKDEVSEWFLNSSGLQCDTAKSDRAG